MPTLNRPRLEELAAHLLANADEHDQGAYGQRTDYGTWLCAGGWTVVLAGMEIAWCEFDANEVCPTRRGERITAQASMAYDPIKGWFVGIEAAATELLGLNPGQVERLFYGFGDTNDVVGVIKDILNEEAAA
jgi:hypothetical protein